MRDIEGKLHAHMNAQKSTKSKASLDDAKFEVKVFANLIRKELSIVETDRLMIMMAEPN